MSWAMVVVGVGTAVYKGIKGANQKSEGKKLLKEAGDGIPADAVQAASEGLPAEQYAQAMKNIKQNQSTAIARAQDRRMGLAAIGGIQNNTDNAVGRLDAENAAARRQNKQRLQGYQDKAFNRKYGYGMQLMGAGNTNISSGIDDAIYGVGSGISRGAFARRSGDSMTGSEAMGMLSYQSPRARQYNPDYIPLDERIP